MHLTHRDVSQFQEKVGYIGMLSGEHTALVVVAGLDKATIPMHCYLAMAGALAIHTSGEIILNIVCH